MNFNLLFRDEFELLPSQGTLEPLERHQAYVLFTPTTEGSHNCVLQLDVQNGATSHVKLKAFVQSAKVRLSASFEFGEF